ncbi:hypothetical protein DID75_00620 [Candidatus Marinamargulisbacteria bacterium SCGC AG-410-N11]|nr:hypothetical protein DID75_00620 [Candidatus Marinamargulisbacteria bacterium SCGC AG-410-N11]
MRVNNQLFAFITTLSLVIFLITGCGKASKLGKTDSEQGSNVSNTNTSSDQPDNKTNGNSNFSQNIKEFTISSDKGFATISWDNPTSEKVTYELRRSLENKLVTPNTLVDGQKINHSLLMAKDLNVTLFSSYIYTLFMLDNDSKILDKYSQKVIITDTYPPKKPSLFSYNLKLSSIELTWNNPVDDFSKVLLFKALQPLSTFDESLAIYNGSLSSFKDLAPTNNHYYYYIYSKDLANNKSEVASINFLIQQPLSSINSVSNIESSINKDNIILKWNNPNDTNLKGILIKRKNKEQNNDTFVTIFDGLLSPSQYEDSNISNSQITYEYELTAYNNDLAYSSPIYHEVTSLDRIPPNPVSNITYSITPISETESTLTVNWINPLDDDIKDILIIKNDHSSNELTTISSGKLITQVSQNEKNGSTFNYTLVVRDINGNESNQASIEINIKSSLKIIEPLTNFKLSKLDNSIKLTWKNPTIDSFQNFINRSKFPINSITDGIQIASTNQDSFTDTTILFDGSTYYYSLFTKDLNENIFSKISTANFITTDEIPPSLPNIFNVSVTDNNKLILSWSLPSDNDLNSVIISRKINDIFSIHPSGTIIYEGLDESFVDTIELNGSNYHYMLYSKDKNDLISEKVLTNTFKSEDKTPPKNPTMFHGIFNNDKITLYWNHPSDSDFSHSLITKTKDIPGNIPSNIILNSKDLISNDLIYEDNNLDYQSGYYYAIYTVDTSGNLSKPIHFYTNYINSIFADYNNSFTIKSNQELWGSGTVSSKQLGDLIVDKQWQLISNDIKFITTSDFHTYLIDNNNIAWGSGENRFDQIGYSTPSNTDDNVNSAIDNMKPNWKYVKSNIQTIDSSFYHSMYVDQNGNLYAIGQNSNFQLGLNSTENKDIWTKSFENIQSVKLGHLHSYALKKDGSLWVVGDNLNGQLGTQDLERQETWTNVLNDVQRIDSGKYFCLALKDNSLWIVGNPLGSEKILSWTKVLDNVIDFSAGSNHALAIKSDGSVWGFGQNHSGQLGTNNTINQTTWVKVFDNATLIATGKYHSLILKQDGSVWGTGLNSDNQISSSDSQTITSWTAIKF